MKLFRLAFQRETAIPVIALLIASATSVTLTVVRIIWTRNLLYSFMIWNLFLAWLPMIFALLACEKYRGECGRRWGFLGWGERCCLSSALNVSIKERSLRRAEPVLSISSMRRVV